MSNGTVTVSEPDYIKEARKDLIDRTTALVDEGIPVYEGDRVADFTPNQRAGLDALAGFAGSPGAQQGIDAALAANLFWSDPATALDYRNIPGLADAESSIQNQVGTYLTETALPAIAEDALLAGGLGGSRQGVAQGIAVGKTSEALANELARLRVNLSSQLLGTHEGALNRVGNLLTAGTIPGQTLLEAGAIEQGQEQTELQGLIDEFQDRANAPYLGLDQLRASLGGAGGSTTTSRPEEGNLASQLLGYYIFGRGSGVFPNIPGGGSPVGGGFGGGSNESYDLPFAY